MSSVLSLIKLLNRDGDVRVELDTHYDSDVDSEYRSSEEDEISNFEEYFEENEEVQQVSVDGYYNDYANSDDEVVTPNDTEDEGDNIRNIHRGQLYDLGCPIEMTTFQLGMRFESSSPFTIADKNYAVWNGFNIRFLKSDKHKVEVVCEKDCPWRMYASFNGKEAFVVKTVIDDHKCNRAVRNRQADHNWIANLFLKRF